jgi:5-hydroxyisourate hydrolase-like protein (transthyretin family)
VTGLTNSIITRLFLGPARPLSAARGARQAAAHLLDLMSGKPGRDGEICLSQLAADVVTDDGMVVRASAGDRAHQADRR